jgi:FdhE protein
MGNTAYELESVSADIDRIIERRPHAGAILHAFRSIILEKIRLLQRLQDDKRTFPLDATRFCEGVALIQQVQLFLPDDPWKEIATAVTGAISQGFPTLAQDMERLGEQVAAGEVDCYDFFREPSADGDLQLVTWASEIQISTTALGLFLRVVASLILSKRRMDMAEELKPLPWTKGYCPVCASMPMLSVIREEGQQWLQCSQCRHEWIFPRMTCPYCNHQSPDATEYFYVEGETNEKALVCGKCKRYLVTVNQAGALNRSHPAVIAMSLTHLDLILQEKGYSQMVVSDWNSL